MDYLKYDVEGIIYLIYGMSSVYVKVVINKSICNVLYGYLQLLILVYFYSNKVELEHWR